MQPDVNPPHLIHLDSIAFEERVVTYCCVASTALYVYDYLITLDTEVNLVWRSVWTPAKVLFLLNRYSPFIEFILVLCHQFWRGLTASVCERLVEISAWLFVAGCCIAEVILTLRTWVIWDRKAPVAVLLASFFVITWVGICIAVALSLHELKHFSPLQLGCLMSSLTKLMSLTYILLAVYDLGLLVAIVCKFLSVRSKRLSRVSSLAQVMYRDGIIYYAFLTSLSIINVVLVLHLSKEYQLPLIVFERVTCASLTSRVVFNIRLQIYGKDHGRPRATTLTST